MSLWDVIGKFQRYDLTDEFDKDVVDSIRAIVEYVDGAVVVNEVAIAEDAKWRDRAGVEDTCAPDDWLAECEEAFEVGLETFGEHANWINNFGPRLIAAAHERDKLRAQLASSGTAASKFNKAWLGALDERDDAYKARNKAEAERDRLRATLAACEGERDGARCSRNAAEGDWVELRAKLGEAELKWAGYLEDNNRLRAKLAACEHNEFKPLQPNNANDNIEDWSEGVWVLGTTENNSYVNVRQSYFVELRKTTRALRQQLKDAQDESFEKVLARLRQL